MGEKKGKEYKKEKWNHKKKQKQEANEKLSMFYLKKKTFKRKI